MKGFNLLSSPSKMPGKSFSLPALKSCPWAVTEPGPDGKPAICAGCYARDGQYRMPNVRDTQAARFDWVRRCMKTPSGRRMFIAAMDDAIKRLRPKRGDSRVYFRIHDSGDFFSPYYVWCWREICERNPNVSFWAPTKSYNGNDQIQAALLALAYLPNVTIRPSATYFGEQPPRIPGFAAGSASNGPADFNCPAYSKDPSKPAKCGSCRVCWDLPSVSVNYHVHGQQAGKLVQIRLDAQKEKARKLRALIAEVSGGAK